MFFRAAYIRAVESQFAFAVRNAEMEERSRIEDALRPYLFKPGHPRGHLAEIVAVCCCVTTQDKVFKLVAAYKECARNARKRTDAKTGKGAEENIRKLLQREKARSLEVIGRRVADAAPGGVLHPHVVVNLDGMHGRIIADAVVDIDTWITTESISPSPLWGDVWPKVLATVIAALIVSGVYWVRRQGMSLWHGLTTAQVIARARLENEVDLQEKSRPHKYTWLLGKRLKIIPTPLHPGTSGKGLVPLDSFWRCTAAGDTEITLEEQSMNYVKTLPGQLVKRLAPGDVLEMSCLLVIQDGMVATRYVGGSER